MIKSIKRIVLKTSWHSNKKERREKIGKIRKKEDDEYFANEELWFGRSWKKENIQYSYFKDNPDTHF